MPVAPSRSHRVLAEVKRRWFSFSVFWIALPEVVRLGLVILFLISCALAFG
jgi:hypothetical protein